MNVFLRNLLVIYILLWGHQGLGGVLFSGGGTVRYFSFQPIEHENTLNYGTIGIVTTLGYSFLQVYDIGLVGFYTTAKEDGRFGSKGINGLSSEDLAFAGGGGQVGVRISQSVYVGLQGGQARYQSYNKTMTEHTVEGRWEGPFGGLVLGSIHKVDKKNYIQLSFEFVHAVLDKVEKQEVSADQLVEESKSRSVDQFGVTLTYTFNGFMNRFRRGGIFNFF